MNDEVLTKLKLLFKKYVPTSKPSEQAQMCLLWSTTNPPDVLENTNQHEDIEIEFNIDISESEAVEIYDMNLLEASKFIQKLIETSKAQS